MVPHYPASPVLYYLFVGFLYCQWLKYGYSLFMGSKMHPLALRSKARNDYMLGTGSLQEIAEHYGVKVRTVREWAYKEKWGESRKTMIQARAERINQDLDRIQDLIRASPDGKQVQAFSTAYEKLHSVMAWITGMPRPGVRWEPKPKSRRSRGDEY